jgi:hypothetical protein
MCDLDDNAFKLDGDLGWGRAPCLKDLAGTSLRYDRDGDAFEGDGVRASRLADSNFSFIPFSSTVVSGDVWGGLSAAML